MPYLGRKGPYLNSNDTQGAWIGSAMNASCSWLGLNQNITVNSQRVYQRGFQCTYGMQVRPAPAALAPALHSLAHLIQTRASLHATVLSRCCAACLDVGRHDQLLNLPL